jgi:autotransporter-associated beta strand protein
MMITTRTRTLTFVLAATVTMLVAAPAAQAVQLTWTGGAGDDWNTTDTNWSGGNGNSWTGPAGNGQNNDALFNTAGATPEVSGTVYTKGITFNENATVGDAGSGIITLEGGNDITVAPGKSATITAVIDGTVGLEKLGTGTLYLVPGGNAINALPNTFTGEATLAQGTLQFGA